MSDTQSQCKGHNQWGHHFHGGWDADREERIDVEGATYFGNGSSRGNHGREEGDSREVAQETGDKGCRIGYQGGDNQHSSRLATDVGNGGSDESHDDKRDDESQEFTEYSIEGYKYADNGGRKEVSEQDAQCDSDDDSAKQTDSDAFHKMMFVNVKVQR